MSADPYRYFRIEARELVEQLSKTALELERGSGMDLGPRLLRTAHTLKGAARVVKQVEVGDLAHSIEDLVAPFRESPSPLPRSVIDSILSLVDAIAARLSALGGVASAPSKQAALAQPSTDGSATVHADARDVDGVLEGIAEARVELGAITRLKKRLEHMNELALEIEAEPQGSAATRRERVGALRAAMVALDRDLGAALQRTERELEDVFASAERLRLSPAKLLFTALERTARDAAAAAGVQVAFEAKGGDVRLDSKVLASVQAALVQAVRNSVAHGIEPANERRATGKALAGRIAVSVRRHGRRVVFSCRDDGRGLDLDAVRKLAAERGLAATDAEKLGSEELVQLLLHGGLSTARGVTGLSGRGVGLDVLRHAAEELGGTVDLRGEPGLGTTVELAVPAFVASLEVLFAVAGEATVAIPLDAVHHAERLGEETITSSPSGETVSCDGVLVPLVALAPLLGSPGAAEPRARRHAVRLAVVLRGASGTVALEVQRLLGTGNVLLRPLPVLAPATAVVAGAWFDVDGHPRLVLEPEGLVEAALAAPKPSAAPQPRRRPLLVIDDSLTTRKLEQSILESAGYEVELAVSAEDGLAKARAANYGLFLVDVEMPGMDGFEFLQQTRADPQLRHTPAVMVTSRSQPEDRKRAAELGARGYVVKGDFDQNELLSLIEELLS